MAPGDRVAPESMSTLRWVAIALALVTAAVHLLLGIGFLPHWMGGAFLVATAGFGLGITLVLLDYRRRLVYLLGIPFTVGQVVLWYTVNQPASLGELTAAGVVDKVAQLLLIAALVVLYRRE
ncbi:DUF7475 family protein [Natronorubrum sp. FCH18a]|uniref:DUF7475 family protein n=1 Tax=Natronorubrum sp. FCH18a TaxID=3447018 RepID=UPI003F50D60F